MDFHYELHIVKQNESLLSYMKKSKIVAFSLAWKAEATAYNILDNIIDIATVVSAKK